jgi:hypothetical protein
MSAAKTPEQPVVEPITLEQIKHRAEGIKDLAVVETKDAVGRVLHEDATKTLLVVAGIVVVAASLAYFLGSRAGRSYIVGGD